MGECRSHLPDASAEDLEACVETICEGEVPACHTCTPESCFAEVAWAMQVGIPAGLYSHGRWNLPVDEYSCFEEVQRALRALPPGSGLKSIIPIPCSFGERENYRKNGLTYCRLARLAAPACRLDGNFSGC